MLRGTLPEISTLSSYEEQIELLDDDTSEPMNLNGCQNIIVTIAPGGSDQARSGYRSRGALVVVSISDGGVVLQPDGLSFTLKLKRSQLQLLGPKTYELGVRLVFEDDVNEAQVALTYLPVVEGL